PVAAAGRGQADSRAFAFIVADGHGSTPAGEEAFSVAYFPRFATKKWSLPQDNPRRLVFLQSARYIPGLNFHAHPGIAGRHGFRVNREGGAGAGGELGERGGLDAS